MRVVLAAGRGPRRSAVRSLTSLVTDLNGLQKLLGSPRFEELGRFGITLALIVLVAHAAALLSWKGLGPVEVSGPRPAPAVTRQPAKRPVPGVPAVARKAAPSGLYLFGKAEVEPEVKSAATTTAPKTTLSLELKGVIALTPTERALAIICEKGKKGEDEIYAVGDKVPGNAEVKGIYADRVILARGGRYETLFLSEEQESAGFSPVERESEPQEAGPGVTSLGDDQNWRINKSYWEQKTADIPALAKEVGVEVYKENGVQQGFKIVSAKGSKLLEELGLHPGDILFEVNGVKLTNASQGLTAYKMLKDAAQIEMVVGRDGQRLSHSYSIDANN